MIGSSVLTNSGCWGCVRGERSNGQQLAIELDSVLPDGQHAWEYESKEEIKQAPAAAPGTPVFTPLGTGVLIAYRHDGVHVVRLWGPRGSPGSALAYFPNTADITPIAAAVGVAVVTPLGSGTVLAYRPNEAAAFVVKLSYGTAYMSSASVSCPVAKVMPLVELAANRHAALAAGAAVEESVRILLARLSESDASAAGGGSRSSSRSSSRSPNRAAASTDASSENGTGSGSGLQGRASLADEAEYLAAHPQEAAQRLEAAAAAATPEIRRVLAVLQAKKKDLDALIAKADVRNTSDGSVDTQLASVSSPTPLKAARALIEAMIGRRDALLSGPALQMHLRSLDALCKSDPAVNAAAGDLRSKAAKALELQRQLEASKAANVLREGRGRLEKQLRCMAEDWGADASTANEARRRVESLIRALAANDSPAMGKGREVLELATEAFQRRASNGTIGARALEAAGRRVVATAAAATVRPQDALRLLQGGFGSSGDLSRYKLPSGALLRLTEQLVLRTLQNAPAPPLCQQLKGYEPAPLPQNALEAYSAAELLLRFDSGKLTAEIAANLLSRAGGGAMSAIRKSLAWQTGERARKLLRTVSVPNPETGAAPDGPAARALRQLLADSGAGQDGSGEIDLEAFVSRAAALLDSDEGAAAAASVMADMERGLTGLSKAGAGLSKSAAVRGLLKRLADPSLEKKLLAGIEGVDAAALVDSAEKAVESREERAKLLDRVKDATVDFLLQHLPALEVPPISGTSGAVRYSVTNLDMSGFRMRKNDVIVVLRDMDGSPVVGPGALNRKKLLSPAQNSGNATSSTNQGSNSSPQNDGSSRTSNTSAGGVSSGGGSSVDAAVSPPNESSRSPNGSGVYSPPVVRGVSEALAVDAVKSPARAARVDLSVSPAAAAVAGASNGGNATPPPNTATTPTMTPPKTLSPESFSGRTSPVGYPNGASAPQSLSASTQRGLPPLASPSQQRPPLGAARPAGSSSGGGGSNGRRHSAPAGPPKARLPPPEGEVFTIVASGIAAEFRGLRWACKQERFPYGSSSGTADAIVVGGSVTLGFAVKRGRLLATADGGAADGPLLVLSSKQVEMEKLDLSVGECSLAWLVNLLAQVFASTIRQYVERSLVDLLEAHTSELLGAVNGFAKDSWPLLLSLANVELNRLPRATPNELKQARGALDPRRSSPEPIRTLRRHRSFVLGAPAPPPPLDATSAPPPLRAHDFALEFAVAGPLGMKVDVVCGGAKSGGGGGGSSSASRLMVLGAFPGGQAERVAAAAAAEAAAVSGGVPPLPLAGAEIVRIGDLEVAALEGVNILEVLKASPRPLVITFRQWRPDTGAAAAATAATAASSTPPPPPPGLQTVNFSARVLGLRLRPSPTLGPRVVEVKGFVRGENGEIFAAEAGGVIRAGMVLYSAKGERIMGMDYEEATARLAALGRPVEMGFLRGCEERVTVSAPPDDLRLRLSHGHVVVTALAPVRSQLQAEGRVAVGDVVVAVNSLPLPTDKGFDRDVSMLCTAAMYPLDLSLRRIPGPGVPPLPPPTATPQKQLAGAAAAAAVATVTAVTSATSALLTGSSATELPPLPPSATHDAIVQTPGDLCATFEPNAKGAPVIVRLAGVPGPATRSGRVSPGMALVSVGGAAVAAEAATVAACWRLIGEAKYPAELVFRDLKRWAELTALLEEEQSVRPFS